MANGFIDANILAHTAARERIAADTPQFIANSWSSLASVATTLIGDEKDGSHPSAMDTLAWIDDSFDNRWFDKETIATVAVEAALPLTSLQVMALDTTNSFGLKDLSRFARAKIAHLEQLEAVVGKGVSYTERKGHDRAFEIHQEELVSRVQATSLEQVVAAQKVRILSHAFRIAAIHAEALTASSRARHELQTAIATIGSFELQRRNDSSVGNNESTEAMPTTITAELQPMEVDWRILPEGEGVLRQAAEDIVTSQRERGREVEVDPKRLLVLSQLRAQWGKDNAYYAKCSLTSRTIPDSNGNETPDEYILLILQERDAEGMVQAEHAVAESPITERNATYVFRQDIDGLSWRDVMALDKKTARSFHARAVKHTRIGGEWTPEMTTSKVATLLAASPEHFVSGEFMGLYGLRLRREVGRTALDGTAGEIARP